MCITILVNIGWKMSTNEEEAILEIRLIIQAMSFISKKNSLCRLLKYIGNTQICLLYLHFQVSLTGLKQKTFGSLLHDSIYQKSKDQTILSAKKTEIKQMLFSLDISKFAKKFAWKNCK